MIYFFLFSTGLVTAFTKRKRLNRELEHNTHIFVSHISSLLGKDEGSYMKS